MSAGLGYPDFQTFPQWSSGNLLASSNVNQAPGSVAGPVIPVSQWAAVHLRVLPSAGQAKLTINWWQDLAGTNGAGSITFNVRNGTGVSVVIPNEAQFMQLTINNTGAVNFVARATLFGVNAHAGKVVYPIVSNEVNVLNETIPLSGSAKHPLGWVQPGPVWLNINPADGTGKLQFFLTLEDEAGNTIGNLTGPLTPTADFNEQLLTVPEILSLHVFNLDGVNPHTYSATLLIAPP